MQQLVRLVEPQPRSLKPNPRGGGKKGGKMEIQVKREVQRGRSPQKKKRRKCHVKDHVTVRKWGRENFKREGRGPMWSEREPRPERSPNLASEGRVGRRGAMVNQERFGDKKGGKGLLGYYW